MPQSSAIVMTTINHPTAAVKKIAGLHPEWEFIVVGDKKTPADWQWPGVRFIPYEEQVQSGGRFATLCPANHYARKNVGYLAAMRLGAGVIAETDDDNIPYDTFLSSLSPSVAGRVVQKKGWENVYTHFTSTPIWPRGLPLEEVLPSFRTASPLGEETLAACSIQQFLADGDPDVDAVYRLTREGEVRFEANTVILEDGTFCPFNSQNTVWWPAAFPLLYLPCHVSFRVTDIWRAFVAEACTYAMGGRVAFLSATVFQERNEHSLLRDFEDEVPGYLHNAQIVELLAGLDLAPEPAAAAGNVRRCYEELVGAGFVPADELELLGAWLDDVDAALAPA